MPGTTAEPLPHPRRHVPAQGRGGTQPPPSLYPGPATSCHPAQPCLRERDHGARWQSHLHRDIPSIPLPRLHPRGREPAGGPVPPVTLGPGFSRSHVRSLEEVAYAVGATIPSLLRAPNRLSHRGCHGCCWSPGWGVWVRGPSWHSPVPRSDPPGGSHPSQGWQLGDHKDGAPQQRGHPGAAATLPVPGPTRQLRCSPVASQ